jgi:pimeloyl-ACP methyl ester carboxylesterase
MPAVNVNGYDLYYEDNDFTDPWRPSEVVFLNHYGYGNLRLYYKWVPLLAREYRVVRLDRRGFGRSQAPPFGYELTVEDMLSDWLGFLDALGISRVHFVGDRFGGSVGAAFAATYPERVRSLTHDGQPHAHAARQAPLRTGRRKRPGGRFLAGRQQDLGPPYGRPRWQLRRAAQGPLRPRADGDYPATHALSLPPSLRES